MIWPSSNSAMGNIKNNNKFKGILRYKSYLYNYFLYPPGITVKFLYLKKPSNAILKNLILSCFLVGCNFEDNKPITGGMVLIWHY